MVKRRRSLKRPTESKLDSRILAQQQNNTVSKVDHGHLDKIEDTAGNYMEIHYDNDTVDGAF